MEFLKENWFVIVSVVLIVFIAFKGNKLLGGHIHGGCCSGSYAPNNPSKDNLEDDKGK